MKAMRRWAGQWRSLGLMISCVLFGCAGGARAQDASSWKDIETKYIFGFTTGSGIGLEGEKEFTIDTIGRFGKRDGHYAATETKYESNLRRPSSSRLSLARSERPTISAA